MPKLLSLFKLQFKGMLYVLSPSGKKTKVTSIWAILAGMAAIMLYISGVYSFTLAKELSAFQATFLVPMLMLALGSFMVLILTIRTTGAFIFSKENAEKLLSLPVTSFQIILSNLTAVLIECFLPLLLFMLPATAAYLYYEKAPWYYLIFALIGIVLFTFLVSAISLVGGFGLSLISSKTRNQRWIEILFNLIIIVPVIYLQFSLTSSMQKMIENSGDVFGAIERYLPPVYWYHQFTVLGDGAALLKLVLSTIIPFLVLIKVFSYLYQNITTALNTSVSKQNFVLKEMGISSKPKALLRREISRYVNSTIYFINTFFGNLMLLGAVVYFLLQKDSLLLMVQQMDLPLARMIIAGMLFVACMDVTTAPSISLEGKYFWILMSSPIEPKDLFDAKLKLHYLVNLPFLILSGLILAFSLPMTLYERLMILILPVLASILQGHVGLLLGLLFPKMDAANDTVIVKNSAAVMLTILPPLVLLAGFFALSTSLEDKPWNLFLLAFAVILVILTLILRRLIYKDPNKRLQKIAEM